MLATKVLVAALAVAVLTPISWQQSSSQGSAFKVGFPVAVAPTANGTWTWTNGDNQAVPRGPIAVAGVVPNRSNQFATITDISILMTPGNVSIPTVWWLRDGTTAQVLYAGAFSPTTITGISPGRDSVHLSTPIVLDHGSANPPTIEFGVNLGTHDAVNGYPYVCTVLGRYTDFQ